MYRANESDANYLLYDGWETQKFNNTATLGWSHFYKYKNGNGVISLELTSSSIGSDYDYSKATFTSIHKNKIGKLRFNTRFYAQYGTGNNWASESQLYLAGANPEELMENKFTASKGFIPTEWVEYGETTNKFHSGGGLNLRGYAGYLAPEVLANGETANLYKNTTGTSVSVELEFNKIIPIVNRLKNVTAYLFADAGVININPIEQEVYRLNLTDLRTDAGVGLTYTIKKWGPLEMVRPFTIRFDFPLAFNKYPNIDESDIQTNEFIMGIGRTF